MIKAGGVVVDTLLYLDGLLRYVRLQEGDAPPSGGARTRLLLTTHMAGKIKFQIWHLFILVPNFFFKSNVFVY